MKKVTRILALALSVVMCLSLVVGCGKKDGGNSGAKDTLVVGYSPFSSKFSPFFSETAYDQDVYTMTALPLLTSDRTGAIVEKGIKGETRNYNGTDYTYYGPADMTVSENPDGTVYYDFTLRDDLKFSDGEPITIDDVIFSMYVLCDPTYDGASTLYAQPIQGMAEYRSGMSTMSKYLGKLGEGSTDFSVVDEATQKAFWDAVNDGGVKFAQEIVDYMVANAGVAMSRPLLPAGASMAWLTMLPLRISSWPLLPSMTGTSPPWRLRLPVPLCPICCLRMCTPPPPRLSPSVSPLPASPVSRRPAITACVLCSARSPLPPCISWAL